MNKILLFLIGWMSMCNLTFGQTTYTGIFYPTNTSQGVHTDQWFNLVPNSGTIAANSWNIYHTDGTSLFGIFYGAAQPYIQLGTSRATNFFVNGNVGIGNNNPQTKLDVSGDIRAATRYQFTTANAYTNASYAVIGLASGSPGKNIVFYNYDGPINELMTINGTTGTTAINNGGLTVSGNVGIGTLIPDQKLTVKGVVHASEVQIDLNVPGPDYVFEKGYTLPKLEEVKSYVEANKHLPEVPSAKEMEKNGIQVGEMNMILLKKVEELTLYIIEQQKQINELKEAIKK